MEKIDRYASLGYLLVNVEKTIKFINIFFVRMKNPVLGI